MQHTSYQFSLYFFVYSVAIWTAFTGHLAGNLYNIGEIVNKVISICETYSEIVNKVISICETYSIIHTFVLRYNHSISSSPPSLSPLIQTVQMSI